MAVIHGHSGLSGDTISIYEAGSISDMPGFQYASLLDGLYAYRRRSPDRVHLWDGNAVSGGNNRIDFIKKGWGNGGGIQFDTMGKFIDEDAFVNERLIGE